MGSNNLRDEGAIAVCNALKESKVSKLAYLDLEDNGIGADGAKAIAAYCAVSPSLTKVDVRGNGLGEEGKAALQKAIVGRLGFELQLEF